MLHVNHAALHLAWKMWQCQPFNEPAPVFPGLPSLDSAADLKAVNASARQERTIQTRRVQRGQCVGWRIRSVHRRQRVLPWFAATGRAAFRSAVTAPLPPPQFYPLHCASLRRLALVCEQRLGLRRGRLRINGAGLGTGEGAAGGGKLHAPPQLRSATERGGASEGSVLCCRWCAGEGGAGGGKLCGPPQLLVPARLVQEKELRPGLVTWRQNAVPTERVKCMHTLFIGPSPCRGRPPGSPARRSAACRRGSLGGGGDGKAVDWSQPMQ